MDYFTIPEALFCALGPGLVPLSAGCYELINFSIHTGFGVLFFLVNA
jgi:hypothetical protein